MLQHLTLTRHAETRMRQRGFRDADIEFLFSVSTQVAPDAFMLTKRDAAREIQKRKREIQALERLQGSKLIVEKDDLITCYPMAGGSKRQRRKRRRR